MSYINDAKQAFYAYRDSLEADPVSNSSSARVAVQRAKDAVQEALEAGQTILEGDASAEDVVAELSMARDRLDEADKLIEHAMNLIMGAARRVNTAADGLGKA